jgi:small subunit ribosomal protein S13
MTINFNDMVQSHSTILKFLKTFSGLSLTLVTFLCKRYGVSPSAIASDVSKQKLLKLKIHIERRVPIEGRITRIKSDAIRRFIVNKSTKGSRLLRGLPVRGQRTRANAQTQKKLKVFFNKKYIENAST